MQIMWKYKEQHDMITQENLTPQDKNKSTMKELKFLQ